MKKACPEFSIGFNDEVSGEIKELIVRVFWTMKINLVIVVIAWISNRLRSCLLGIVWQGNEL